MFPGIGDSQYYNFKENKSAFIERKNRNKPKALTLRGDTGDKVPRLENFYNIGR